jgi:hypothetical protein
MFLGLLNRHEGISRSREVVCFAWTVGPKDTLELDFSRIVRADLANGISSSPVYSSAQDFGQHSLVPRFAQHGEIRTACFEMRPLFWAGL